MSWLVRLSERRPDAALRLVCFACAGGGPRQFRDWAEMLPDRVEVCAVCLPGRESRFRERPVPELVALADNVTSKIEADGSLPVVLFGHSFGALLAFETARRLSNASDGVVALLVAACRAPNLPARRPALYDAPEAELLAFLRTLQGEDLPDAPELIELLLPSVRADFQAYETYVFDVAAPLGCPIVAFGGRDDEEVNENELAAWRVHTTGAFAMHMLSSGHFFLRNRRSELLGVIAEVAESL